MRLNPKAQTPKVLINKKSNNMKKIILTIAIALFAITINAQTPPEPNGGNGAPDGGNTPVGGGAPVGSGLAVLLALGAAYGGKKVYDFSRRNA